MCPSNFLKLRFKQQFGQSYQADQILQYQFFKKVLKNLKKSFFQLDSIVRRVGSKISKRRQFY